MKKFLKFFYSFLACKLLSAKNRVSAYFQASMVKALDVFVDE
jgi:hypothetical protein